MDDVAAELGISKRTLYEIFDKKDLLFEAMKHYYNERSEKLQVKVQDCQNVMEIILAIYRIKVEEFRQMNPNFYADLEKYPQVLRFLDNENRKNRVKFLRFMERGVQEASSVVILTTKLCSSLQCPGHLYHAAQTLSSVFDGRYIQKSHLRHPTEVYVQSRD